MSKILELLNYSKKRDANKKEEAGDLSDRIAPENFDSHTREKLANTYIFNPGTSSKHVIKKQDKGISSHKHNAIGSTSRFGYLFPWLISFLAILLLLVNIAYRGKINIKIEILNQDATQPASQASSNVSAIAAPEKEEAKNITPISTSLIAEQQYNSYIIKRLGFYGGATNKSRILEDGLYLFNDGTSTWASAGIELTEPMDLSDSTLDFFIKGANGNESLRLILRDFENKSYVPQAHNAVFNKNMEAGWQFVSIPFKGFEGAYNAKKINHIGFEFGTETTSNEPGASIYIKKIRIVKNGVTP